MDMPTVPVDHLVYLHPPFVGETIVDRGLDLLLGCLLQHFLLFAGRQINHHSHHQGYHCLLVCLNLCGLTNEVLCRGAEVTQNDRTMLVLQVRVSRLTTNVGGMIAGEARRHVLRMVMARTRLSRMTRTVLLLLS